MPKKKESKKETSKKELKDFSTEELKAVVYDHLISIEKSQVTIKAIQEELIKRN